MTDSQEQEMPDPLAVFMMTQALYGRYRALSDTCKDVLVDTHSGCDGVLRMMLEVVERFEQWACEHVDFDMFEEVYVYWLEDHFAEAFCKVTGQLQDDPYLVTLGRLSDDECAAIAKELALPIIQKVTQKNEVEPAPSTAGCAEEVGRQAVELLALSAQLLRLRGTMDKVAWKMLSTMTSDPVGFPKAVCIGSVRTDTASLHINGRTGGKPFTINTGGDGVFKVYADNFVDGIPGRLIIPLIHPLTTPSND